MKILTKSILAALAFSAVTGSLAEVVVIVSARSKVVELSKRQVSELFLGKLATYPDGSQAVPIELADGTPARAEFHDKFTGKSTSQLKAYWSKMVFGGMGSPPKEVPGPVEMKQLVAENPNIIGYLDRSLVDGSVKVVASP